jgi:hypothetical protein
MDGRARTVNQEEGLDQPALKPSHAPANLDLPPRRKGKMLVATGPIPIRVHISF